MPIPSTPCDSPEVCCTDLADIAYHLLTETFDALSDCQEPGCDSAIASYITMGLGDDGIVDSLTVAMFSAAGSPSNRPGTFGLYRAEFDVRLRESGWPTAAVEGGVITLPDPAVQASAARYMLSRGEAMHRKLAALASRRQLAPASVRCTNGTVGRLTPLTPQGGVVGWAISVSLDLPWN